MGFMYLVSELPVLHHVRRMAFQSPIELAEECCRLSNENEKLRQALIEIYTSAGVTGHWKEVLKIAKEALDGG